ncbi:MAG: metallopeptidase TldD-related protein [Anaerolineales bacterium]
MTENNHKDRILDTLHTLRKYALEKTASNHIEIGLFYHEEDSYLMRFANSAISLNTNEHLIRLDITAYQGRKRASYELITDLSKLDQMKHGVDTAIELVQHAQPLNYQPTIPVYKETFSDESCYDPNLSLISNAERLDFFNQAVSELESDEMKSSGIFSSGSSISAMIYTTSEYFQFFRHSDAQVTPVLSHTGLKWELISEGSAQQITDLDASKLNQDLTTLISHYQGDTPQQLSLGSYDIVFGSAAIADMLSMMNWIGFNGGNMKRGYSFLSEAQVGKKVFSEQFTLTDDPNQREAFPFWRDFYGLPRDRFPIFEHGVFQGFTWTQDDADEFNAQPTGHTVPHKSLTLSGGERDTPATLQELIAMSRDRDLLYIPYLHYMNIVNPSKGVITASSRFGALMLRQDGSVSVPYNVRLTQSLLDIFGEKVDWLARQTVAYNTTMSYGKRNPTAVIVPAFMRVNDLEISHSNDSY